MHVLSKKMRSGFIGFVALGFVISGAPLSAGQSAAGLNDTAPYQIAQADAVATESELWNALRSGDHLALLRHALAPGTGDPADFDVDDCATQRNLSNRGRDQARRIGARFRGNAIPVAAVYSSQWCRCLETARLLALGPVTEQPILNSFFRKYERREPQTRMLRQWIARQDLASPMILVTHQVNITALTDVYPQSGELVVLRRDTAGELSVVGTIRTE
jgi:phosphohistidine phosphatase SixA